MRRGCLASLLAGWVILSAWFAMETSRAFRQRRAIHAVWKLGGYVRFEREKPTIRSLPRHWLRTFLGDDFMNRVVVVRLANTETADRDLARLKEFSKLRVLDLRDTRVGNAGLRHIRNFGELRLLVLTATAVTDAGLAHLEGLARLEALSLEETGITDEGLGHLARLERLAWLDLSGTHVGDGGLPRLARLTGLRALILQETNASQDGLARLRDGMPGTGIFDERNRAPFFNFSYN